LTLVIDICAKTMLVATHGCFTSCDERLVIAFQGSIEVPIRARFGHSVSWIYSGKATIDAICV
jgi:hypothetical protein